MRILSDLADLAPRGPVAFAVGFFDGVHRGHQAALRRLAELAAAAPARPVLLTCWPDPYSLLRPDEPTPLLTTRDEKLALLDALGVLDAAVVLPLTPELEALAPEAFLARLEEHAIPRAFVLVPDAMAEWQPLGRFDRLRRIGAEQGFAVERVGVAGDGEPVFMVIAARIRRLVADGHVEEAAELLGRPYAVAGTVVAGDRRGRQLGFPTANLRLDPAKLIPANGVYAVRARLADEERAARPAVANVGVRPTFGASPTRLVEVHLLDAQLDLYDRPLAVEFGARLREERRFAGVEALRAQIAADADQARALLASPAARPGAGG
jgi:riboflavin kinase/FMN adenylyltransferase